MDTVPSGHHTWAELLTRVDAAAGVRYFPAGDGGDCQNPGRIPRLRRRQPDLQIKRRNRPERLRHLSDGPSAPTLG
jgi:hypothetical protein